MGRAISMSEAIAIEVEVEVEGDRHRRQALVTAVGKYLAAHDPDKASPRAQLYRMWLLTGVEGWFCSDCAEELETESRIKHRPVVRSNKPIYRRCGER